MTDTALVGNGIILQVWRDTTEQMLTAEGVGGTLIEFESGQVVCGMLWNGSALSIPPTAAPSVPDSVTPYQARKALSDAGLRASVEAVIAAASQETQDAWQYGISVERHSPMIANLAGILGLTSEQIDSLFVAAAAVI